MDGATCASTRSPTRGWSSRPTRSSRSRRPGFADPICISTRCSAHSSTRGTSSGTSRWASSRRSAPRSTTSNRATGWWSRSTSPAATAGCAISGSTRSARRRRITTTARAPPSSATPSSTARSPAVRLSTSACPQAQFGPIKVPEGPPDDRFVYLSDVLPTAWQAVEYAAIPEGGASRSSGSVPSARWPRGSRSTAAHRVIGVDLVPERLEMARRTASRRSTSRDRRRARGIREMTNGRGTDSVSTPSGWRRTVPRSAKLAQDAAGLPPDPSPGR